MNLQEAAAACRIKHLFPEAKIIVALREPVSRAVSEINMKRRHCAEQKLADEDGWPYCCDAHFQPVNPKIRQALKSLKDLEDECLNTSSPGNEYRQKQNTVDLELKQAWNMLSTINVKATI